MSFIHEAAWFAQNKIVRGRAPLMHVIRDCTPAFAHAPSKMRCVVAQQRIPKGEVIAIVPSAAVPNATSAVRFLEEAVARSTGSSSRVNAIIDELLRPPPENKGLAVPVPWIASRETATVIAAMAVAKWSTQVRAPASPLEHWVKAMPQKTPPVGSTLLFVKDHVLMRGGVSAPPTVQTERPVVDRFHVPDPTGSSRGAVPSRAVLKPITGVTPKGYASERPYPRHHVTFDELVAVNRALDAWCERVGSSLASGLQAEPDVVMDLLEWAHFAFRSRAVHPRGSDTPRLVPLADMLNHARDNSAVVSQAQDHVAASFSGVASKHAGGIFISAARDIEADEEVTLNYGANGGRTQHALGAQRREGRVGGHMDSTKGGVATEHAFNKRLSAALADAGRQQAMEDANILDDELVWAWSYGFAKPDDDRKSEKEDAWVRSVNARVERMLDRSRRGTKGEYCVGVPPGIDHLAQSRSRVESRLYHGQRVFPQHAE